jgi:hypothetical protein
LEYLGPAETFEMVMVTHDHNLAIFVYIHRYFSEYETVSLFLMVTFTNSPYYSHIPLNKKTDGHDKMADNKVEAREIAHEHITDKCQGT